MNEKSENPFDMASLIDTWMKSMGDFWGSMAGQQHADQAEPHPFQAGDGDQKKSTAAMTAAIKNWQAMLRAITAPESMLAGFKGGGAMPEMALKLTQNAMTGLIELHKKMLQQQNRLGKSVEAYQFTDIDENICRLWTEIYEKEFRQFFQIPQLGLMRTYQEKANQAVDKYNLFQSTLSEYLNLLSMPFTRASRVMQDKLRELMESGEMPDDTKIYYNMWIKVLEGHFMTLFQTPEYVQSLARTVGALADYQAARDAVMEDLLGLLPVARKTDLDDMARELYELKKRMKKLENAHCRAR